MIWRKSAMPWAIVTNYTGEFLGLRWSAPQLDFIAPDPPCCHTTRKSNELELKYTLSVYSQPGHCLISCPLAGLAPAAPPCRAQQQQAEEEQEEQEEDQPEPDLAPTKQLSSMITGPA